MTLVQEFMKSHPSTKTLFISAGIAMASITTALGYAVLDDAEELRLKCDKPEITCTAKEQKDLAEYKSTQYNLAAICSLSMVTAMGAGMASGSRPKEVKVKDPHAPKV